MNVGLYAHLKHLRICLSHVTVFESVVISSNVKEGKRLDCFLFVLFYQTLLWLTLQQWFSDSNFAISNAHSDLRMQRTHGFKVKWVLFVNSEPMNIQEVSSGWAEIECHALFSHKNDFPHWHDIYYHRGNINYFYWRGGVKETELVLPMWVSFINFFVCFVFAYLPLFSHLYAFQTYSIVQSWCNNMDGALGGSIDFPLLPFRLWVII